MYIMNCFDNFKNDRTCSLCMIVYNKQYTYCTHLYTLRKELDKYYNMYALCLDENDPDYFEKKYSYYRCDKYEAVCADYECDPKNKCMKKEFQEKTAYYEQKLKEYKEKLKKMKEIDVMN